MARLTDAFTNFLDLVSRFVKDRIDYFRNNSRTP